MSIIGGLLLIFGAFLMYKSYIYYASICYIVADISWVYLGFLTGNMAGTLLILIGATLNVGVFIKMHRNEFVRNLKKENSERD